MKIKFFYQDFCSKCPAAKVAIEPFRSKSLIEDYNITTSEGLAEAALYGVLSTPALMIDRGEDIIVFTDIKVAVRELKKALILYKT